MDETLGGLFKDFSPLLSFIISCCLFVCLYYFSLGILAFPFSVFLFFFCYFFPPVIHSIINAQDLSESYQDKSCLKTEEISISDSLYPSSPRIEIN